MNLDPRQSQILATMANCSGKPGKSILIPVCECDTDLQIIDSCRPDRFDHALVTVGVQRIHRITPSWNVLSEKLHQFLQEIVRVSPAKELASSGCKNEEPPGFRTRVSISVSLGQASLLPLPTFANWVRMKCQCRGQRFPVPLGKAETRRCLLSTRNDETLSGFRPPVYCLWITSWQGWCAYL